MTTTDPTDPVAATVEQIRSLPAGGSLLVVGAMDRGKTTLINAAARQMTAESTRIAVVDTDIGQSEIGPPGTVGVAWADAACARLHDLRPAALFFVGGITPRAVGLDWVAASAAAIQWARRAGAERIVIDTPGDVDGPIPRRLVSALCRAAAPDTLLALYPSNGPNGDHALALSELAAAACGARVVALPALAAAQRKPITRRTVIRRTRLFAALENGAVLRLPILGPTSSDATAAGPRRVLTAGASLGVGQPVAPHLARWIAETLHLPRLGDASAPGLHAEIDGGMLTVFVESDQALPPIDSHRSGIVTQHFRVDSVRVLLWSALIGACVGLIGENGLTLAIGRFEGLVPGNGDALIYTPLRAADRVRLLHFGRFRLSRDGETAGDLRPGEM